jgi:LAGLIDADG DNA endonuclease family protein
MQEVRRFDPGRLHLNASSLLATWRSVGFVLGGFVAGEGWFGILRPDPPRRDGSQRLRFRFCVTVARRDRRVLEALQAYLGVGCINDAPARHSGWLPQTTFTIGALGAHRRVTIPFAEAFLPPSAKREQFGGWRNTLLEYEGRRPVRTRSICSEPGCDRFVRGRGLCRSHYYRATGY